MFALSVLLLALSVSGSSACECGMPGSARVYAGWEISPHKYPWLAHLRFTSPDSPGSFFQCGGSILDKRTILTAAHCVHDHDTGKLTDAKYAEVYLGAHNKYRMADKYRVTRIIPDSRYKTRYALDYDIAVLKLDKDIIYNKKIGPICVPAEDTTPFKRLVVSGWGSLDAKGTSTSTAREVEVDYIPRTLCTEYKESYYSVLSKVKGYRLTPPPIHHNHMCALDVRTKGDACAGDSGGPLMYKNALNRHFVVGIVSGAWNDCSTPLTPGLYTKVANYRDFIKTNSPNVCIKKFNE